MSTDRPWWQTAVIYQIYPRSFQDSNHDGVGDLPGIIDRLDYLDELGVDAIWLCPFYPSPMRDFGYDVSDYTGVDPLFGTLGDFLTLVDEAHQRGIRIILDFVPNHSSDEHPWFVSSRRSRQNPKRDWYFWHDPAPGGGPPNNWLSVNDRDTSGSAWHFDDATGQYYLGTFSRHQPDLNWHTPALRDAMLGALHVWLERGVDGFRLDMLDFIAKDRHFRDEPPATARADDWFSAARYQLRPDEARRYIGMMASEIRSYPERFSIGEIGWYLSLDQVIAFYDGGEGLELPLYFGLLFAEPIAPDLRDRVERYEAALPDGAWPNLFLANHDTERLSRYGTRTRIGALLLLTLRGTPFLYYGDEIGMPTVDVPRERQQDPHQGRDGARTPMQWDNTPYAGFSDAEPWLPVSLDYRARNVARQRRDPTSLLSLYRRLLKLRKERPALHAGDYHTVSGDDHTWVYRRSHEDDIDVLVALNFSDAPQTVALPGGEYTVLLSACLDREDETVRGHVTLRAGEGVVLEPR
ncbi:MAG: alpha-amylase family glycosyl hydrolase [Trueperaceae bacterium]|nr:alpha-amylase family glycosyl hydrolase [Trueperaceae bacterium]